MGAGLEFASSPPAKWFPPGGPSVRHAPEEEAVGGGVDPGGGTVARPKDFSDVIRGMFPFPRVHHRSDDVAHHVAKKSRAGDVDGDKPGALVPCNLRPEDRADR